MPKYLSGRQKRRSQDQLTDDRYLYLGLDQAEPNLSDPIVGPTVPSGSQYQLVAVPGYPGKRYWVPIGGGLIAGAISVFDEGNPVSSASSITQLNFVGAAVTANVSIQSPSGHPGIAATIIVNPVTISDDPPVGPRSGELWWESDSGDLFVYYNDGDSAQWVTTNTGGAGPAGIKGDKGESGSKGQAGLTGGAGAKGDVGEKGEPGNVLAKGVKGDVGPQGAQGQKGEKGDVGQKGDTGNLGTKGDKGQKGDQGQKGDKGQKGLAGGGANVTISDNAPTSPSTGDLWWDSDDFDLHVYYGDTDSNQWVSITSNAALKGQKGQKGEKGEKGEKGQKGQKGELGGTGIQGPAGPQGDKGNKGDGSSVAGPPGPSGPPGSNSFTGLTDTPANYTSQANKLVSVNSSANGITFVDPTSVGQDTNTTYLLQAQQVSGSNNNPNLLLNASSGTDDTVRLVGGTNVTITRNNNGQITFVSQNDNTQLSAEQVQDIVGAMFTNNTETRISATYQDSDGTIDLVVDDQSSDNNTTYGISCVNGLNTDEERIRLTGTNPSSTDDITLEAGTGLSISRSGDKITFTNTDTGSGANTNTTYDLLVPTGTTKIRLDPSDGSGNDDITITGGSNITVTRTSANELNIASSANLDVTQLDLNRIRFGPGNAFTDDANIEWLGGNNAGYLRISTSDDNGTEYIEIGDYDNVNVTGSFTQWMKLDRSELYMARDVRLNAGLEDKDGQKGSNGQVLVSTGSQVNWVNASTVGGSVDNYVDQLTFSAGTLTLGRTGSLSNLTTTIPLSGITGGFTDLDDTPSGYSGDANKVVVVNSSANGLTFTNASTVGTDTNYYLSGLSFNTGNGVLTATVTGASNQTVDLDGRYAQSSEGVPLGTIVIWYGSISNIPNGWSLCNGQTVNSYQTPDLRNRFVVGSWSDSANAAWPNTAPGHTGGSADATLVAHSHTINNHTHQINNHTHTFSGTVNNTNLSHSHTYSSANHPTGSGPEQNQTGSPEDRTTFNVGKTTGSALGNHNHTYSGTTGNPSNRGTGNPSNRGTDSQGSSADDANLPPYYSLAYIMKTS